MALEQHAIGVRHLFGRPLGNWWHTALSVAAATIVATPLFVDSRSAALLALGTVATATLIMIGIGVRRHRPPAPASWYLLGASSILFAVGTAMRVFTIDHAHPLDDAATLAGYIGVGVAAYLWLCPRRASCPPDVMLDSALIGLGSLLASWMFLISPVLHATHTLDRATVLAVVFPLLDAGLLTLVTHSMVTATRSEVSLRPVHVSALAVVVTDVLHNLDTAGTIHLDHRVLLVPTLFAYLAMGLAALQPTMTALGGPRQIHPHQSRQRANVIAVALVVASMVPAVGTRLSAVDRIVVSALLACLLIGVLARSERAIVRSARSERRAQYQADHDMLTGLLNRSALLRAPSRDQERWTGRPVCLLFIDLDGFKTINDSYGHAVGDELIANAAARIRRIIRRDDMAARYGGDEFVVLADGGRQEAEELAERLLATFAEPFELSVGEVRIAASLGIARSGPRSADATVYDLLREADSAMYHAKEYSLGYTFHEDVRHRGHTDLAHCRWPREQAV
ncbi:GGDEF domain-containing protein [Nocardia terpenica]|uniref:Diguanylate cyclase n=1 Tax=Nocardia terpenica TaxID=455432 RepID=A0A6G9Z9I7_9NOCA|nr:GGDEF domain-containing protein [Nocardia terpenica]QIS22255.1 diguanylate cyclase [Nocardia terpenica]